MNSEPEHSWRFSLFLDCEDDNRLGFVTVCRMALSSSSDDWNQSSDSASDSDIESLDRAGNTRVCPHSTIGTCDVCFGAYSSGYYRAGGNVFLSSGPIPVMDLRPRAPRVALLPRPTIARGGVIPASARILETLVCYKYAKEVQKVGADCENDNKRLCSDTKDEEPDCVICSDTFEDGDECTDLPCKHTFHVACIMQWFQRSNKCPLCRNEVATDDPKYEQDRPKNNGEGNRR